MERHRKMSRVIAAAAVLATLAVTGLPALAAVPAAAPTNVTILDGGDGIVSNAEKTALTVTADYVADVNPITHGWIAIVANNTCTYAAPKVDSFDFVIPPGPGTMSFTLDVSSLPDGPLCAIVWTKNSDGYSTPGVSAVLSTLATVSNAPVITAPTTGQLVGVSVKNDGSRFFTVRGIGDAPGYSISVFETNEGLLGTTTVNSSGTWALDVVLPTDTYTIWATQTQPGNAESAISNVVVFDLDADLPTASVTWPPDLATVFLPGEPVIIEGVANDTNGQAFAGLLAVEANVHDPLIIEQRLVNLDNPGQPTVPGNVLGVLNIGEIIRQENVACDSSTPCPAQGVDVVTWSYDASYLPPGTYSIQFLAHDMAGNEAIQPAVTRFTKLG